MPLRGTVAYPDLIVPLVVGRERSIRLIDEAMGKDRLIGILTQKNPDIEDPELEDLYTIGTVATIMKMVKMVDGSQRIVVQGLARFKLIEFTRGSPTSGRAYSPSMRSTRKTSRSTRCIST